jgi:transposase
MSQTAAVLIPAAVDYERTLVLSIEVSNKSWVLAAQVPGLPHTKAKRSIDPKAEALMAAIAGYRARAATTGRSIERVIAVYEAGWSGFWLARWLMRHGVEVYVIQPSSVPVDRRMRRAKSDGIDAELLLRTLLAWLRGEPRVCSMVPIPDEADEDARRGVRERTELISERIGLVNRISAVLATLGVSDYNPLLRNRHRRLAELRTGLGEPLPLNAHAKIVRLLARLELVLAQVATLEHERDAVVETEASDQASKMIQQLASLRGIGVQSATVLVREAFVRRFANGKSLGRRPGFLTIQQRWDRPRAGHRKGWQPASQNRDGRASVAMDALPARCRPGLLVPRKGWINWTARSQNHGGGPGEKTADRAVEVRHRRRGA